MSYQDVYDIFNRALEDPKGIRLPYDNYTDAKYFQMRMHQARVIDRKENAKIFPPGDVLHGQSQYDVLQVKLVGPVDDEHSPTGSTTFVYVEPKDKNIPDIESLSEIEENNNHA
jgi:hypothetical protein